jgi:hypothetical protein
MTVNSRNMPVIKQQVHVMSLQILHVPLVGIKYVPFFKMLNFLLWARIVEQRLATVCTVRGSNFGGGESAPVQTSPEVHPASCTAGNGSQSRRSSDLVVALTTHTHLAPKSLLPSCAFMTCRMANFYITFLDMPDYGRSRPKYEAY